MASLAPWGPCVGPSVCLEQVPWVATGLPTLTLPLPGTTADARTSPLLPHAYFPVALWLIVEFSIIFCLNLSIKIALA